MASTIDQELFDLVKLIEARLSAELENSSSCDWALTPDAPRPRLERRLINIIRHRITREAHHFLLNGTLKHLFIKIDSSEYITLICIDDSSRVLIFAEIGSQLLHSFNVPLAQIEPFKPNISRLRV